jgi:predicted phosphodiesterase
MRLLVLSDLHVEVAPFATLRPDADLIVLAGDIHNGAPAVRWARGTFPDRPIVQIAGNHEFYDGEYHAVLAELRAAAAAEGVHFLENEACVVAGVRFLGCTLWTDHRVLEAPGRQPGMSAAQAMAASRRANPDFSAIRIAQPPRAFTPEDAAVLHETSKAWLAGALDQRFDGPTVVVTHHLPSWRSVNPLYASSPSNAAFVSELDSLVERADLWIHGHTHASCAYAVGRSRVRCNPRGYPRTSAEPFVFENPDFDAGLVIEVPAA